MNNNLECIFRKLLATLHGTIVLAEFLIENEAETGYFAAINLFLC